MGEYRFDLLGWYQFERLCQTLLLASLGLQIEAWGGSGDWGRDAYSEESLRFPDPEVEQAGPFLFQVKYVRDAAVANDKGVGALKGAVVKEAEKLEALIDDGEWESPAHYVLMTNVRVPNGQRKHVTAPIDQVVDGSVHLMHEPDVENLLTTQPRVRMSFPQVLSLRDLSGLIEEVVNRDLANRAADVLVAAQKLAEIFVPTWPYYQAIDALAKHHFVVLSGPPEMGKTSIARILALARASDGWDVVSCLAPNDFDRAYKSELKQVFVADDAFGSTEYQPQRAQDWADAMGSIIRRLDGTHWLIWTSRSEPLTRGLAKLKFADAENFPAPSSVIVKAETLSVQEKTLMLYRHAKTADLSSEAKALIRLWGARIVSHDDFTPLRVARFVSNRAGQLAADKRSYADIVAAVEEEMSEPTQGMTTSFAVLDPHDQDLLVSLLDADGPISPTELEEVFDRHRQEGAPAASAIATRLEEHFLRRL